MADKITRAGRLIAIDGSRGKDVAAAAGAVTEALTSAGVTCAISRWDASGLFGELAAGRSNRQLSIRTLSLVYAADLAFRLRWEIRPALEAGGVVIASSYVDTAAAVAAAGGLADEWVRELMRFAPRADWLGRAEERKPGKGWRARLDRGYAEYCAAMLNGAAVDLTARRARRDAVARLERTRARNVHHLSGRSIAALVQAVTDSRPAVSRRSPSRPRSART